MDFYRIIPKCVVCITNPAVRQSDYPRSCRLTGKLYLCRSKWKPANQGVGVSKSKKKKTNLIGPVIRMYTDEAGFRNCSALEENQNQITRKTAPTGDEMGFGYGAWLVQLIADHFPKATQVTVTELDSKAGWRTIPGWSIAQGQQVLAILERKGIIRVDRLMEPWIVQKAADESSLWKKFYDDLI